MSYRAAIVDLEIQVDTDMRASGLPFCISFPTSFPGFLTVTWQLVSWFPQQISSAKE